MQRAFEQFEQALDNFCNFALLVTEFANFNHKFPVMYVANDFS